MKDEGKSEGRGLLAVLLQMPSGDSGKGQQQPHIEKHTGGASLAPFLVPPRV